MLVSSSVFCQIFVGPENGYKTMASDDVYYDWEEFAFSDSAGIIESEISVKLVSSSDGYSLVKLRKWEMEMVEETYTDFTFNSIDEDPETTVSTSIYALLLDERIFAKVRYHFPANANGTSVVRYTFYDPKGEANNVIHTITYKTRIRGCEDIPNAIDIYPNPASSNITIDYSFCKSYPMASVEIVNLLGVSIQEYNILSQEGDFKVDVSDYKPGIYFCNFKTENEIFQVVKLIIN